MPTPPPTPAENEWLKTRPHERRCTVSPAPAGGWLIVPNELQKLAHECPLPRVWNYGTLYQCPDGHLWVVGSACICGGETLRHYCSPHTNRLTWQPATWWQRRRYGPGMKRATLDMDPANTREQPKPKPPKSPSGISSMYGNPAKTREQPKPKPPKSPSGISSTYGKEGTTDDIDD